MQCVVVCQLHPLNPIVKNGERLCNRHVVIFRGERGECVRICKAFAGGEDDKIRTMPWEISIEDAEIWDSFFD